MPWKVASLFRKVQLDDLVVPNKRKTSKNHLTLLQFELFSCTSYLCLIVPQHLNLLSVKFIAFSNKIHWKLCRRIFQQSCKIRFHITSIDLHVCVILFTRGVNYLTFSPRLWNNFFVLSTIDHHAMFSSNT